MTILNKLSRDIFDLYVFIVTKLKAFSTYIISQKKLTFKEFALYSMVIFAFNNSYAAHCDSLKAVVNSYERQYSIPRNLLWSIASVESKGNPLAINLDGKAYVARTAKEAKFIVESFIDDGITNIDLGLTQINLKHHGKNFDDIGDMMDINKNLNYAAQLLCKLYKLHGGWREAVQHYHSSTPKHYVKYARKVLVEWMKS